MSYRALWTADVHIYNGLPYAKRGADSLITDRLIDTVSVLKEMGRYAQTNGIEDLWIAGDLFDKRLLDAITLRAVIRTLHKLLATDAVNRIHMIGGNHDAHDAAAVYYTLDALSEMGEDRIRIYDAEERPLPPEEFGGVRFLPVSYKPKMATREILEEAAEQKWAKDTFVVGHQTIVGVRSGEWIAPDGIRPQELAPFAGAILGHYHDPQDITDQIFYLGAPLQHTFGDAGSERGFWDISIEGPKIVERTKVRVTSVPKFHVIPVQATIEGGKLRVDVDDETGQAAAPQAGDYVWVQVHGTEDAVKRTEEWTSQYEMLQREVGVRLVKVTHVVTAAAKSRLKIKKTAGGTISIPAAMRGYVEQQNPEGLDRARVLELGERALSAAGEKL